MTKWIVGCLGLMLCVTAIGDVLPGDTVPEDPATKPTATETSADRSDRDRSPVDVVVTSDGNWLISVNQTSDTISLVRLSDGVVVSEAPCGRHPAAIALTPDGRRALVSATYSGELAVFDIEAGRLRRTGSIQLGFEPRGIAISPDATLAYVALTASNEVAVVDLAALKVLARIEVGRWPRYLALTPDGSRLAVGCSGDGGISVVDTQTRLKLYDSKFLGLNIGHVQTSADGAYAYFPWMVYADRPITPGNIREGWVLGNRVARVRLDGPARREALALDRADRPWPIRTAWQSAPTVNGWSCRPRARTS